MKTRWMMIAVMFLASLAFAQEEALPWKKGGQGTLNFSQTALSNWSGGGQNALSLNGFVSVFANYKQDILSWDNTLDLAYGVVNQGGVVQKTDDKIDLSSKFGYTASGNWNYSGILAFKTQMTRGYADTLKISSFAAPAYLQIAFGMEYKPNEDISLFISPLSGKMTLVLDPDLAAAGSFGLTPGQKVRGEFGAYAKVQYRKTIVENVVFQTKCDIFMNYLENQQFIDVNWEVLLAMKINEFLSASISTQMVYDQDYSAKLQFKETLGIGLSFSF
ncbi:MAG: DUF3078 domain-containing protein [Candidatus Neomarinimicrobiota bacterium]|jgi:hypothetical protein|nr:DUF3078 domain-containing protein [Candidatus Neomarinimicrobiota bacterium]MDX9780768.1 DUF3078 domain-containing protein [bacterium]